MVVVSDDLVSGALVECSMTVEIGAQRAQSPGDALTGTATLAIEALA